MNFIKSTFASILKYSIWALVWYGLANFFAMIYLNFLDFINSGIFNKSVKILIGVIVSLLAIVMLTVVSLSIAGKISKLICVNLMKIKSLKNDSFELPDMPDISGIFETTPEEKYREYKRARKKQTLKENNGNHYLFGIFPIEDERITNMRNEYETLSYRISELKEKARSLPVDGFFTPLDIETWKEVGKKRSKLEREIYELEVKQNELKSKIQELGGSIYR